ncbi:MAG: hypothetical protein ACJ746_22740 [Bryobacteraceae bacterium]
MTPESGDMGADLVIRETWIAAEHIDATPSRRVCIVNPEAGFEHLPEVFAVGSSAQVRDFAASFPRSLVPRPPAVNEHGNDTETD